MVERVTSFNKVKVGDTKYLFVFGAWTEPETNLKRDALRQRLDDAVTKFGMALEDMGTTAQSIPSYDLENTRLLIAKPWPKDVGRLFDGHLLADNDSLPFFLLVIDKDFVDFDPRIHNAAIMWLRYSARDVADFQRVCDALAQRVKLGRDLFEYFHSQFEKIAPDKRGKFPGTWQEQKLAEEYLNFRVETYENFLSFDLAMLSEQTQKSLPAWFVGKVRRFPGTLMKWVSVVWKDQVGSKLVSATIIGVCALVLGALATWFGLPFWPSK